MSVRNDGISIFLLLQIVVFPFNLLCGLYNLSYLSTFVDNLIYFCRYFKRDIIFFNIP